MNFNSCLRYLDQLHKLNHKSSISRFKQKLSELNCYPRTPKIFTVAGTNGKGTCCVTFEAILLAGGYKTGCYLSPHLLSITERVRINGQNISEQEFVAAFIKIKNIYLEEEVGWFEFVSLIALLIFAAHPLDFLILEIGIGGKQDVINAIDPDVAIITTIDLDHTEILGHTRELIAAEKAGIFRANKLAICAEPNLPSTLIDYAQAINTNLILYNRDYFYTETSEGWCYAVIAREAKQSSTSPLLPYPTFPVANAAAAITALQNFPKTRAISWTAIINGIKQAFLPGRFQVLTQQPLMICDVAHNPHAAGYLAKQLQQLPCSGTTHAIVGMQCKKDIPNTLAAMLNVVDQWYISNLDEQDKSIVTFVNIAQKFLQQADAQFTVMPSITAGVKLALQTAQKEDRIIIFGSFLTVEEVLQATC